MSWINLTRQSRREIEKERKRERERDLSMPQTLQHEVTAIAEAAEPPEAPQALAHGKKDAERSWQRVERHLMEIRRIATAYRDRPTDTTGIMHNAEQALIHLLVDTPTAHALESDGGSQVVQHGEIPISSASGSGEKPSTQHRRKLPHNCTRRSFSTS